MVLLLYGYCGMPCALCPRRARDCKSHVLGLDSTWQVRMRVREHADPVGRMCKFENKGPDAIG
jgi:hypothetical protein